MTQHLAMFSPSSSSMLAISPIFNSYSTPPLYPSLLQLHVPSTAHARTLLGQATR